MDPRKEQLDAAVREHLATHGEVLPPWIAYAGIEPDDIGWRMGSGEWYIMVFGYWWERAHPDEQSRLAYFRTHRPPTEWIDWAASAVWPIDFDAEDIDTELDAVVQRLTDRGIGDYIAWQTWHDTRML